MKYFRDELLEFLFAHSGEFMDIQHLVNKYCGEDDTFEPGDESKSRCRLRLNLVLRELQDMDWIKLYPHHGISTAHGYNQAIGKRQFLHDESVKARMTMTGEIEYRKLRQEPTPQVYNDHSIKVGGNLSGNANTGTDVKQFIGEDDKGMGKKNYRLNRWMVALAVVAIIVAIAIYLLQRGHQ